MKERLPRMEMLLVADFAFADQDFYTCTSLMARFQRVDGVEVCIKQAITGSKRFAQQHLAFIKDNFKFVSNGQWERPYGNDIPLKVIATFEKEDGEDPGFFITYETEPSK